MARVFFLRGCFWLLLLGVLGGGALSAQTSETKADRDLRDLVERQQTLLGRAAEAEDEVQIDDLRPQLQTLIFDFEKFLRDYPNHVAGYVSYAMLLGNPLLDERKRAAALLLKANELNPDLPIVKNQLGKYLAEDGRPLEALNYFLAAVQLEPTEPLYHFQVGQLLSAARQDFVQSGEWTDEQVETAMQRAFEQATTLAPENVAYAYRWAESFYDLKYPEWARALEAWHAVEQLVSSSIERQTVQLHRANVLLKQGQLAAAEAALEQVTEPVLQGQKDRLRAELSGSADTPSAEAEQG